MRGPVAAVMSTGTLVALVFGYQASQALRHDDATNASVKDTKPTVAPMPTVPTTAPPVTTSTTAQVPGDGPVRVTVAPTVPVAFPSYSVSVAPPPPPSASPTGPPHDAGLPPVIILPPPGSAPPSPTPTHTPESTDTPKAYTGIPAMTQWGPMQVRIHTARGMVLGVTVLQRPGGFSTSEEINSKLLPYLNAQVAQQQKYERLDGISGATISTEAYSRSLQSAVNQWRGR